MIIFAVADKPSKYLELSLTKLNKSIKADVVCGCGDVPRESLDLLKLYVNDTLLLVHGNEDKPPVSLSLASSLSMDTEDYYELLQKPSGKVLHGKTAVIQGVMFCGFSGILSDREKAYHYSERKMRRIVNKVMRKIRWRRAWDWLRFQPAKPVVVLSHLAPDEIANPGFKCFRSFMKKIKPLLWLHGHDPLSSYAQIKNRQNGPTLIVNVHEFKRIEILGSQISVDFSLH